MCGEKISGICRKCLSLGSPPRVRGKGIVHVFVSEEFGITPACAGKSALCVNGGARSRDHPRMCGEKTAREFITYLIQGSPPRMRGKVLLSPFFQPMPGITPAYAGKRVFASTRLCNSRDHPRMCGEKKNCLERGGEKAGSPPHVRGKANQRL